MSKKNATKKYRAAGGVVLNAAGEVLLLEREVPRADTPAHEVRLPKGHIEPGESAQDAALREVGEESGYWGLEIIADLGEAMTTFFFRGKRIERIEHYYLMHLTDPNRSQTRPKSPTAEEALFQPLWVPDLAAAERLLTFASEKEFVRRAQQWLDAHA